MSEPERHVPDLEDLAAYVDGRLSAERRAWVEAHLLRDEELYEVFLATVEFQKEHGRSAEKPNPRWSRIWLLLPLAAAAALALTLAPSLLRERAPTQKWAELLEPAAIAALNEDWSDPGWSRKRGENCPLPEALPFRMGAWSLDLRLALLAGDDVEAQQLALQLANLAACGGLYLQESAYSQLAAQWTVTRAVDRREQATSIEKGLAELFGDDPRELRLFRLGGWAEAGRLAAATRNAPALARIIRNAPETGEIPEIKPQLAKLESLAKRSALEPQDFTAADEAFRAILDQPAG